MSDFWSIWISVITFIVILGSVWLLMANRKTEVKGDLAEGEIPKTGTSMMALRSMTTHCLPGGSGCLWLAQCLP